MSFLDLLKKNAAVDPLHNPVEDSKRAIDDNLKAISSFEKNVRHRSLKGTFTVSEVSRTVGCYVLEAKKESIVSTEQHDDLEKFLISLSVKFKALISRFDAEVISKVRNKNNKINKRVLFGTGFCCLLFFFAMTGLLFSNQVVDITPVQENLLAEADDEKKMGYVADDVATEESVPTSTEGWALKINGNTVLYASSKEEADSIIEKVKASYVGENNELVEASIIESIEVVQETTQPDLVFADEDGAVTYILTGSKEPKIYTVVKGDSAWKIATSNNLSLEELVQANPDMTPEKIMIGQQLNLYEIKPYVTIRTVEIARENERIDFSTNYENSEDMYKGQQKVIVKGVPGSKEVQTQLTKENGKVVDSVVLASSVISEPQPQVTAVGTKPVATFTGTGSLISPLTNIEISSAFGSRGNRRHQGVDMRSPSGTPIHAADDGVVTTSKYQGSYGNLIILSHGKGLETYYAHCSSMAVSVGQVVNKGDVIGYVGTTGNATGAHLHFEVRLNGVYQNPLNYF
jgi:murein DD-endopeptidase MepM/ murein hydrolase activator NlpD